MQPVTPADGDPVPQRILLVDCPTCARKAPFDPSNRWRPFCSARCKTVDLGAWAAERYRIAGDAAGESANDAGAPAPRDGA